MKFRIGNLSVRIGPSPIETNNFFSIEHRDSSYLLRMSACAEEFDSALSFYVQFCEGTRAKTHSWWFELRRSKNRLPSQIVNRIGIVGYTRCGALYGDVRSSEISPLMNAFWLSGRFRMIGTVQMQKTTALEMAIALDDQDLKDSSTRLPAGVTFILEQQYFGHESFLAVLFESHELNSTRELLERIAAGLRHPLLEVGPGGWPPDRTISRTDQFG